MKKIMILMAAVITLSLGAAAQSTVAYPKLTVPAGTQLNLITLDSASGLKGDYVYPSQPSSVKYTLPDTVIAPDGSTKVLPARITKVSYTVPGQVDMSIRLDSSITDQKRLRYWRLKQK